MSLSKLYFSSQSLASLLASSSRLRCLHINAAAQSSASPNGTPTPTPTAIGLLDEDDGLWHVDRVERVAAVDVVAEETVAVAVWLPVDEVEADGRLDITLPTSTWNGSELPRVLLMHSLVDELPGPQQKDESFWKG